MVVLWAITRFLSRCRYFRTMRMLHTVSVSFIALVWPIKLAFLSQPMCSFWETCETKILWWVSVLRVILWNLVNFGFLISNAENVKGHGIVAKLSCIEASEKKIHFHVNVEKLKVFMNCSTMKIRSLGDIKLCTKEVNVTPLVPSVCVDTGFVNFFVQSRTVIWKKQTPEEETTNAHACKIEGQELWFHRSDFVL